jgi:DNA-binding transcriptional regulator YiaG
LLAEFERSGVSGKKFAALVGVNYQTFASWRQQRKKAVVGSIPHR